MIPIEDLTDLTRADDDTNSMLIDNANAAIQGNVTMQVTQSGGQLWTCNTNSATKHIFENTGSMFVYYTSKALGEKMQKVHYEKRK